MSRTTHVIRKALLPAVAALVALSPLTGCSSSGAARPATTSPSTAAGRPAQPDSPAATAQVTDAAAPVEVSIPSIGVSGPLMRLGLNRDGTVEVPPAEKGMTAGWYTGGAVPGEPGAAVLIGHNDTRYGRAVFHHLKEIARGAEIIVRDGDGGRARFAVTGTETVRKNAFPTEKVYGATGERVLRLVTCDGAFDADGHPVDNLIVYASAR
ncbi:class F sortase [Streptomyces sp. B1I3]|uniref:class F sortase n=1 Tax=Streptomyces sp. B1I3 TaxID=3042264 RepID=UPI00277E47F4|nr:class F sortase [Streptomyces sp. B1I3]MDQ0792843.1 LPXTG-site transpeptidase (sortase) family protein [Streptomyces sp. B1I3]